MTELLRSRTRPSCMDFPSSIWIHDRENTSYYFNHSIIAVIQPYFQLFQARAGVSISLRGIPGGGNYISMNTVKNTMCSQMTNDSLEKTLDTFSWWEPESSRRKSWKNWNWVKYVGLLRLLRSDCTYPTNVIKRTTLPISILDNSICGHIKIIPNGRKQR